MIENQEDGDYLPPLLCRLTHYPQRLTLRSTEPLIPLTLYTILQFILTYLLQELSKPHNASSISLLQVTIPTAANLNAKFGVSSEWSGDQISCSVLP